MLTGNAAVYRFLNSSGEVLYIGKTVNLEQRMAMHKKRGHLKAEQYEMVSSVQAMMLPTYNDAGICERYFISKYNPPFNSSLTNEGPVTIEIILPEWCCWVDVGIDLSGKRPDTYHTYTETPSYKYVSAEENAKIFINSACDTSSFYNRSKNSLIENRARFYEHYTEYCEEKRCDPMGRTKFFKLVERSGYRAKCVDGERFFDGIVSERAKEMFETAKSALDKPQELVSHYLEQNRGYKVCVASVWHECLRLDGKPSRLESQKIMELISSTPGWKRAKNPVLFKKYGRQRYYTFDRISAGL